MEKIVFIRFTDDIVVIVDGAKELTNIFIEMETILNGMQNEIMIVKVRKNF